MLYSKNLIALGLLVFFLYFAKAEHVKAILVDANIKGLFDCINETNKKRLPILLVPEKHSQGEDLRLKLSQLVESERIFLASEGLYHNNQDLKATYLRLQGYSSEDSKKFSGLFGIEQEEAHVSAGLLVAIKEIDHMKNAISKGIIQREEAAVRSLYQFFIRIKNSPSLQEVFNATKMNMDPEIVQLFVNYQDPAFNPLNYLNPKKLSKNLFDLEHIRKQYVLLSKSYIDSKVTKKIEAPPNFDELTKNVYNGSDKEEFYLPINIKWRDSFMLKNLSKAYCDSLTNIKESQKAFVVVLGSDHAESMLNLIQSLATAPATTIAPRL